MISFFTAIILIYLLIIAFMYFNQRNLLYHPSENNYSESLKHFHKSLERNPNNVKALNNIGNAIGQYEIEYVDRIQHNTTIYGSRLNGLNTKLYASGGVIDKINNPPGFSKSKAFLTN